MMYIRDKRRVKRWFCNGVAAVVAVAILVLLVNVVLAMVNGVSFLMAEGDDSGAVWLWLLLHIALLTLMSKLEVWMCGKGLKAGCATMYAWTKRTIFDIDDEDMAQMRVVQSYSRAATCCLLMITLALGATVPVDGGVSLSERVWLSRQSDMASAIMMAENILIYTAWGLSLLVLVVEVVGLVWHRLALRQEVAKRAR